MTKMEARRIIRKAVRLIVPKLEQGFGEARIQEVVAGGLIDWDIKKVLQYKRLPVTDERYQRMEKYMPNTIPFDEFEEAMSTIPDRMLHTAIKMGLKDCNY